MQGEWIPVIRYQSGLWLGVSDGELHIGTEHEPTKPIDHANLVGLLPLLELDRDQVMSTIGRKEREAGLAVGTISDLISLKSILRTAISMRSEYWTELALDWVEILPNDQELSDALTGLVTANWASQKVRHRAKRKLS
ncbi:hypothetical protein [Nocardia yunnanensis]|uniref:hypothetical protein n=1 Tax=Nocardia yunnanensis TaxID=2382165 RepID=UPI0013C447C6|nr:hypothetical protein [Nocardia yunnanensis]